MSHSPNLVFLIWIYWCRSIQKKLHRYYYFHLRLRIAWNDTRFIDPKLEVSILIFLTSNKTWILMVQMHCLNRNLIIFWRVCHAFRELKEASLRPSEVPWAIATCHWHLVSSMNKPICFLSGLQNWWGSLGVTSTCKLISEQSHKFCLISFHVFGLGGYSFRPSVICLSQTNQILCSIFPR